VEEEADGGDEGCGGAEQQVDGNGQNDEEESCLVEGGKEFVFLFF
jgi:hypothetical protein